MKTEIKEILNNKSLVENNAIVCGWVKTRRDSKAGCSFISIHDGSCFASLQIVAPNSLSNYETEVLHITTGYAIEVHGKIVTSQGQGQTVEIVANEIKIVGEVIYKERYPITSKFHTLEHLRDWAHLRARTNTIGAIARVRNALSFAIHEFFYKKGFVYVHTPIITSNDCEGAGQMFKVTTLDLNNLPYTDDNLDNTKRRIDFSKDFFGKETFLTVSGQLDVEAYCLALSKVYTFGPTFRAENSNTTRHLSEFWMIEPEIAFATLDDIALLAEEMLKYLADFLLRERADDMHFFNERIDKNCITRLNQIIEKDFKRMTYTDAVDALLKSNKSFEFPVSWGCDLQSEHERYIAEELIHGPVAITDYPKKIKSFYMKQNQDNKTVRAMDILVPEMGEIIGGGQREDDLETLEHHIAELHMDKNNYQWYLDLRRFGSAPHAGFGLGFERLISYFTGVKNVRDVIPFPRAPKSADY